MHAHTEIKCANHNGCKHENGHNEINTKCTHTKTEKKRAIKEKGKPTAKTDYKIRQETLT